MSVLYNQYIYKDGAWRQIGVSSESVTYTLSISGGNLILTGSDGSTSTVNAGGAEPITSSEINNIVLYGLRSN